VIILHIGPHKTATTYIQQSLASSRKALEKSGWIYPILGSNNTAGHHDLAHKPELYLNSGLLKISNCFSIFSQKKKLKSFTLSENLRLFYTPIGLRLSSKGNHKLFLSFLRNIMNPLSFLILLTLLLRFLR